MCAKYAPHGFAQTESAEKDSPSYEQPCHANLGHDCRCSCRCRHRVRRNQHAGCWQGEEGHQRRDGPVGQICCLNPLGMTPSPTGGDKECAYHRCGGQGLPCAVWLKSMCAVHPTDPNVTAAQAEKPQAVLRHECAPHLCSISSGGDFAHALVFGAIGHAHDCAIPCRPTLHGIACCCKLAKSQSYLQSMHHPSSHASTYKMYCSLSGAFNAFCRMARASGHGKVQLVRWHGAARMAAPRTEKELPS